MWSGQAQLYSDYFENLDPTLDAAAAGIQVRNRRRNAIIFQGFLFQASHICIMRQLKDLGVKFTARIRVGGRATRLVGWPRGG